MAVEIVIGGHMHGGMVGEVREEVEQRTTRAGRSTGREERTECLMADRGETGDEESGRGVVAPQWEQETTAQGEQMRTAHRRHMP
jgi:hypothetical protein